MGQVFLFLTDGFEEIEALGTLDVLRRGGVSVMSVSLTGQETVVGSHGIETGADALFADVDFSQAEMLVLPGGTVKINEHDGLKREVGAFAAKGGWIAAICAAPMVLGGLGLLRGRRATCYPGFEGYLDGAIITEEDVVVDGNIITGRGPGLTLPFALELLERLKGPETAVKVADGLLVSR